MKPNESNGIREKYPVQKKAALWDQSKTGISYNKTDSQNDRSNSNLSSMFSLTANRSNGSQKHRNRKAETNP